MERPKRITLWLVSRFLKVWVNVAGVAIPYDSTSWSGYYKQQISLQGLTNAIIVNVSLFLH